MQSGRRESQEISFLFIISCNEGSAKSDGCSSTTMPELLQIEFLPDGDMPFTAICPAPLDAGTTNPPGHMQKL